MFSFMKQGKQFYRQVMALSLPMIVQNLVTSALGMADIFMVGMLGELPMAAVTLANIPLFVIQLFVFGVQSGGSVLISQYWGKEDRQSINRVMGIGFWLAGAVSFVLAFVLLTVPVQFLSFFGNDPAIISLAAEYGRIAGLSYFFNSLSMVYLTAFRSMENPRPAMYVAIVSMLCNTFLNWLLIFGNLGAPKLGVKGAAIATLIARMIEMVIALLHARFNHYFRISPKEFFRPGMEMLRRFVRYGGPVVCNETLWGAGTAVLPTIMGHMAGSAEILAAYAIVGNVEKLAQVAGFGIAAATAIIIGREIGAGRENTVYSKAQALNVLAFFAGAGSGVLMLLFTYTLAQSWLFPLFKLSGGAANIATMMLTMLSFLMAAKEVNSANIIGVLRGGGDVKAATFIDLIPLWGAAIPMAAFCGLVLKTSVFFVYLSFAVEQAVKLGAGIWRLRSKKWIRNITGVVQSPQIEQP